MIDPGSPSHPARAAGLAGLLLAASTGAGCGGFADDPIPVVLVVFDALGAEHVSHLGYERETTPVLDEIARGGYTFENCVVPAPFTTASIPSLLTGRHPDAHGVISSAFQLRDEERTLAEELTDAGWTARAAISQPNGGSRTGNDQGFETFVEMWVVDDPREADVHLPRRGLSYDLVSAEEVVDLGLELAAEDDGRTPFLYLHVLEPHTPFQAPEPWRGRWTDPDYEGPFTEPGSEGLLVDSIQGKFEPDAADRAYVRALYDGNLAWADHNLGRLRDGLRELGLWDEALVVITSDHGEAHWQHGAWGHNWGLYEEFVRVPLVVKPPLGSELGRGRIERMVSTMDVVPTVLDLVGVEPAVSVERAGLSLRPLLAAMASGSEPGDGARSDGPFADRRLLLRSSHEPPRLALRGDRAKTIVRPGERDDPEHYLLAEDPAERDDRADSVAEVRGRLRRLWELWALRSDGPGAVPAEESARDEALLERLGYGDGD